MKKNMRWGAKEDSLAFENGKRGHPKFGKVVLK